ncbi:MAG: type VI secretion system Vgr family protein [Desulfuromonadaceae bacterium]
MALFSQEKRHIKINTPLGKDVLLVESIHGSEGMSRLFSFELSLVTESRGIAFEDIIGESVTVSIDLPWGKKRYLNGIVSRFAQTSGGGTSTGDTRVSTYRLTMVPWFWLLSRSAESRIYQKMTVPEIVEKVFRELGFSEFTLKLQGTYAKRDYCVQYRETHFNFISRLLEDEGIHYFFEHTDGKHKMVLADSSQANIPCQDQKSASYQTSLQDNKDEDFITALEKTQELRPAKYTLNDFNFKIPNTSLKVDLPSKYPLGSGDREIYDYPGEFDNKTEGERFARIRMEEEEAQITTITGTGNCRAFSTGFRFTLNNFYRMDMNGKEFVLTSIEHHASQTVQAGGDFQYGNRFTCIPVDVPFRPSRITPKPFVQGAQTAIVVGPHGEEIYPDEHGRVKVQFHWDRKGKKDENSSCWVRVSQLWAGAGWGSMFIPRIGHEVIVDFLEGDPDQPIITGRVYHGTNKPPYSLPDHKTRSTIKSDTTKGGEGSNELRFEDKKGHEEIYIHGEKDWKIRIKNDKNQKIGHDEVLRVLNNRTKSVGANQNITVGENHTESIGMSMSLTVGLNTTETVAINKAETIGAAKELTIGGAYQVTVGGVMNETVGGAKMEEVGGYRAEIVGGYNQITVGEDLTEKIGGNATLTVSKKLSEEADDITITAKSKLTLVCGGNTIVLDPSGITIKGTLVKINS